ncbi:TetR/AcrR family transcriptional regulator [bacterium]|nr:TetR/AcrR family transcriptional regulator [bacterium]
MESDDAKLDVEKPVLGAKARKTDRRTLYTVQVVKDALLELMQEMPFDKVSVSRLCVQAEISRTSFYAHFASMTEVLNAVIDDALLFSQQSGTAQEGLRALIAHGTLDDVRAHETMLPACQRIADSEKYRHLFADPGLSDYIVSRIARRVRDDMVPQIVRQTGVSPDEAEMILQFMLYGSYHVNQQLGWNKNDEWFRFQRLLSIFTTGGYDAVREAPKL